MSNILTVVILTYHDTKRCIQTIESLLKIDFTFKLLIIDCNENPDSDLVNLVEFKFQNQSEVLHYPNSTIKAAMNFALSGTYTKYIWFLNSGDKLLDASGLIASLMLSNGKVISGTTYIESLHGELKEWVKPDIASWRWKYGFDSICHQSCAIPTQILKNSGSFANEAHFDWLAIVHAIDLVGVVSVPAFKITYLAGGKSSKESLYLWGRNQIVARRNNRHLFKGTLITDCIIFFTYVPLRAFLNFITINKRGKWWQVGN